MELTRKLNEISIAEFYELQNILNDEQLSNLEKNVHLLSIFTRIPYDELLNMPADECEEAIVELSKHFNKTSLDASADKFSLNKITILGTTYKIIDKPDNINVAQYIDFENWINLNKNNIAEVLSVFLIPEGHKYNDGYDITELIDILNNNLDIETANKLYNFFLQTLYKSTTRTLKYSKWIIKTMMIVTGMRWKLNKEQRKELDNALDMITQIPTMLAHG